MQLELLPLLTGREISRFSAKFVAKWKFRIPSTPFSLRHPVIHYAIH